MSKNLQKVQDMLDGKGTGKIQVGQYAPTEEVRKVGDKWTDGDGYKWEQKDGFKVKSGGSMAYKGLGDNCSSCEKLISKPWDKDCYKADGRCYHCQMNYEIDLKAKPIKWFAYRRLKDLRNMESIHRDMEKWVFAKHEFEKDEKIFDKKVANAIANGEVDLTINKNKT